MKIKLDDGDFEEAVARNLLSEDQKVRLLDFFHSRKPKTGAPVTVLSYLGALIVISSMTWFATRVFSEAHPGFALATALIYFAIFTACGLFLLKKLDSTVPSMLLFTIAVFMTPLAIYSFQKLLGVNLFDTPVDYHDFYVWINKGWFFMELGTIAVSLLFLRLFRLEFLTFPLALTLWFLSMDLTPIFFGKDPSWDDRRVVSVYFGLGMLVVSYLLDLFKKDRDFSFWLYLFGLLAFWCGISFSSTDSLILKFLYCGMNLLLIAVALVLRRPVFIVFGALGIFMFLFDLSDNVFRDSFFFPIYLSVVGVILLGLSIALLRVQKKWEAALENKLPGFLKKFIPKA